MTPSFLLAGLLAVSTPTAAAPPPVEVTMKNPWLAAGLSFTAPVALGYATMPAFGVGAPLGFGAGHVYAGDPERGAWVGAGGVATLLGGAAWALYGPNDDLRPRRWNNVALNVAVLTLGYGLWAAFDAHQTASRRNEAIALDGTGPVSVLDGKTAGR